MENNILILGGESLIGNKTALKFANENFNVFSASRKFKNCEANINYIKWDFYDTAERSEIYCLKEYACIIVAAWDGNTKDNRNNEEMNMHCAKSLAGWISAICGNCSVGQIILCGSQAEYGDISGKVTEDIECDVNVLSAYGKSKLYLYKTLTEGNFCSKIAELRFHSVFGYREYKNQMIVDVLKKGLSDEKIVFYSDCLQNYDFVYCDDAADAIFGAYSNNLEGIFNISSGKHMILREYINEALKAINSKSIVLYGNEHCSNDFEFNSDKFRSLTGWSPSVNFEDGIKIIADRMLNGTG